jgi:ABC-type spermidine/putrescine transport system permease subunit II
MTARAFNSKAERLDRLAIKIKKASPGLGFIALGLLYLPIAGLGILSFAERPLTGVPWPLTARWYEQLFETNAQAWESALWHSIGIALLVSIISTALAVAIGRTLPFMKRRGLILISYLSVLVLPGILIGVAVLVFYRILLQLPTGLWSVIFVHVIWALPFSLLCVLIVAARFDVRLLDAAEDLGANRWQQLMDIELPMLKPGISASMFFSFLLSFNELPRTTYVHGGLVTLPYFIWTASSAHSSIVYLIYALSALIMAISFFLTIVAIRLLLGSQR